MPEQICRCGNAKQIKVGDGLPAGTLSVRISGFHPVDVNLSEGEQGRFVGSYFLEALQIEGRIVYGGEIKQIEDLVSSVFYCGACKLLFVELCGPLPPLPVYAYPVLPHRALRHA